MSATTLFRAVRVCDTDSRYHNQQVDLLLEDGHMRINPADVPDEAQRVSLPNLHVSPGWVDIGAGVGEPGHEERETIMSLQRAAAAGGFTHVVVLPDTQPVLDEKGAVEALLARAERHPVSISVIGALSRGKKGAELAEFADMQAAGVRMVGDGLQAVQDAKLLQLALAYAAPLDLAVMSYPDDARLRGNGQLNEGTVSTRMGTPGIAPLCEELGLQRDLMLQAYRGGRLHVHAISLASSLRALEVAMSDTNAVTYAVPVLNLLLTDEAMRGFSVNLKVLPPLRTEADRQALLQAIKSRQASALISNHQPHDIEAKMMEFGYAAFGAASIEHAFAIATTALEDHVAVVDYFSRINRNCARLPSATIEEGMEVDLTFFQPEEAYTVSATPTGSIAHNVPLIGRTLTGKVVGVAIGDEYLAHH